ncbi:MAG: hypothetical protein KDA52_02380 [Planctomycetaceae bacterium]|nr:hypothetical protein [Planctomycetaceae bacterium]
MQRLRKLTTHNCSHRRQGLSQIELTLVLPLMVTLLLAILSVGSVGISQTEVAIESRQDAWEHRHQENPQTLSVTGAESLEQVLRPNATQFLEAGISNGEAEQELIASLPGFFDGMASAQRQDKLMSGTWDHRVLAFEEEDEHPALSLGQRTEAFLSSGVSLDGFGILAISGGGAADPSTLSAAVSMLAPASSANSQGIDYLNNQISQTTQAISQERNSSTPDWNRIGQLRDKLEDLQERLEKLKRAQRLLSDEVRFPSGEEE